MEAAEGPIILGRVWAEYGTQRCGAQRGWELDGYRAGRGTRVWSRDVRAPRRVERNSRVNALLVWNEIVRGRSISYMYVCYRN